MIALLLWATPQAYGLQTVSDPELICSTAARVVLAEVTSAEVSRVQGSRGDLQTTTWLHVVDVLRGRGAIHDTIEVRSRGGRLGEWTHHVSDQPRLELDHRYVLFLDGGDPARVVGGDLGQFEVGHSEARLDALVSTLGRCL